jgi:hypothetical protein
MVLQVICQSIPVPVASWNDALQLRRAPLLSGSNKRSISYMTPATKHKPTAGALRVAGAIQQDASLRLTSLPELIDRETGVREVLEILESIISEAGDLIESRSPELVAAAHAALRRYSDEAPRQAE